MNIAKEFWRNKKVFITGHTGFKGAWLTSILLNMGADITGFSLAPDTSPSLFELLGLADKINHIEGDIRDRGECSTAVIQSQPEIVIHLAAQALVRDSYDNPVDTFDTNVMGTVHLLDILREVDCCKSVVIITSDKCYANDDSGILFSEDCKLSGKDPYSASKAAAEIVTQSYQHSYFKEGKLALATARAGNVIGGGDWAKDRLIPDVVRAYGNSEAVNIRSPKSTRPWQHVLDLSAGYLSLAEKLYTNGQEYSGAWNFGPKAKDIKTVEEVLVLLKKQIDFELVIDDSNHPFEAKTLGLDTKKAVDGLGWSPKLDLEKSIELTGQWYNEYLQNKDVGNITNQQIGDYIVIPV